MTIRELVIDALRLYKGRERTATELCDELQDVKLASLSSELTRMVNDGTLQRIDAQGPRGGAGYKLRNFEGPFTHGRA